MASDSIFELAGHIFPLFSGVQVRDVYRVDRFLGTGFWVDRGGHFLRCKHVLEGLKPGQLPAIGQPFSTSADRFIPILESTLHAAIDIAVAPVHHHGVHIRRLRRFHQHMRWIAEHAQVDVARMRNEAIAAQLNIGRVHVGRGRTCYAEGGWAGIERARAIRALPRNATRSWGCR